MKNVLKTALIVYTLICIGCKNEKEVKAKEKVKIDNYINLSFDFPDTLIINKKYNGKINYKSKLDTITTSFEKENPNRYVFYCFKKGKSHYTEKKLKKIITDTVGARNNREIYLYNISFDSLGINYLDGFIVDEVMIDTLVKQKNGSHKTMRRLITNEFRATHKVIVVAEKK